MPVQGHLVSRPPAGCPAAHRAQDCQAYHLSQPGHGPAHEHDWAYYRNGIQLMSKKAGVAAPISLRAGLLRTAQLPIQPRAARCTISCSQAMILCKTARDRQAVLIKLSMAEELQPLRA